VVSDALILNSSEDDMQTNEIKTCIVDDEVMMIVGGREKGKGRRSIMEVLDGKCLV